MTKTTKAQQTERDEAIATLRGLFPVGATVHTVVRHVSQSGMSRSISVLHVTGGDIRDVSHLVAKALGWRLHPVSAASTSRAAAWTWPSTPSTRSAGSCTTTATASRTAPSSNLQQRVPSGRAREQHP